MNVFSSQARRWNFNKLLFKFLEISACCRREFIHVARQQENRNECVQLKSKKMKFLVYRALIPYGKSFPLANRNKLPFPLLQKRQFFIDKLAEKLPN